MSRKLEILKRFPLGRESTQRKRNSAFKKCKIIINAKKKKLARVRMARNINENNTSFVKKKQFGVKTTSVGLEKRRPSVLVHL